jgi:hypothetical protein
MIDTFGDRMKSYEASFDQVLPPRLPIIVRLDGKAFHTFTRKMNKPFDEQFEQMMDNTALALLKNVQGATAVYVQSDEISLFLKYYSKLDSQPWLGARVNKINSVCTSMTTAFFAKELFVKRDVFAQEIVVPFWDCRSFVLPKEEVYNYFLWRAKDCSRNAILGFGQHKFGHTKCLNKCTGDLLNEIPKDEWDLVWKRSKFGMFAIKGLRRARGEHMLVTETLSNNDVFISCDFMNKNQDLNYLINFIVDYVEEE